MEKAKTHDSAQEIRVKIEDSIKNTYHVSVKLMTPVRLHELLSH